MIDIGHPYYFFGSPDSIDVDVLVDHPEMTGSSSDKEIIKKMIESHPSIQAWNLSLIHIENHIIARTMQRRGSADAVHNSLYYTYNFHLQQYENPLLFPVKRHRLLAVQTCVRTLLSITSATNQKAFYKKHISNVLREGIWTNEVELLSILSYKEQFFDDPVRNLDLLKSLAFDVGQTLSLLQGKEFYTKKEIINAHPELAQLILRQPIDAHAILSNKIKDLQFHINMLEVSQPEKFVISCGVEKVNTRYGVVIS